MKILAIIVLCLNILNINVQSEENSLYGVWKYSEIQNKEDLKAETIPVIENSFVNMAFSLRPDGKFLGMIFGQEDMGDWTLNDKKLVFRSEKVERVIELDVIETSEKQILIQFGDAIVALEKLN